MQISDLSITAQAILAGHWGISKGMTLTLNNRESRLTKKSSDAMSELICEGIVKAEKADNGYAESMTYSLTKTGAEMKINKSFDWMGEHGRFSITEPIK